MEGNKGFGRFIFLRIVRYVLPPYLFDFSSLPFLQFCEFIY